jgi:predicted RNA-binding Zn ribbon-like protein
MDIAYTPQPQSIFRGEWARFIFVAGRLCIDFTQTGGETGKRAYWERLHQPSDLSDWFSESPLQLRQLEVSLEEFNEALFLREAIWRVAQNVLHHETPAAEDIDVLNRVAAQPDVPPQMVGTDLQPSWGSPVTATAALSMVARDAIDLFSGELRSRIRECENPKCGIMFVDASRPGKRRWCLMKRCGNMIKTSRYRQQHSSSQ